MKKLMEGTIQVDNTTGEITGVFLRTPYNYDTNKASIESGLECQDESRAKQSFAEECDINTIVKRFNLTGQLPENIRTPEYRDFEQAMDYHQAMNAVRAAGESFAAMPANVRARFDNDAGKFVDFCSNIENKEEMRKLGLLVPEAFQQDLDLKGKGDTPAPKAPDSKGEGVT